MVLDSINDSTVIYDLDTTNIKILLEQRKTLVDNIKELNGNMFKVIIAVIPCLVSMVLSYYKLIVPTKYAPYIRFAAIEIILILAFSFVFTVAVFVVSAFVSFSAVETESVVSLLTEKELVSAFSFTSLFLTEQPTNTLINITATIHKITDFFI